MSLGGIATLVQPLAIGCVNGFPRILIVSVHDSRGVVEIVTDPPAFTCVGAIESLNAEEAEANPAQTPSAPIAPVKTATH
jgi:hypothetical protein